MSVRLLNAQLSKEAGNNYHRMNMNETLVV